MASKTIMETIYIKTNENENSMIQVN